MTHEWIDNNSDFEAVLACTNELGAWDQDAVIRAFQIYQWDDATTPGNDSSFVHLASGVVVRHDGNMLAIDCGHGHLDEALPDLFSVLHSIGWREAELHHPAATIDAVLADIGRAIPAIMDFEVRPAARSKAIQDFPETAELVSRARQVLGGGDLDQSNSIVLEAMQSMLNENRHGSTVPAIAAAPVTLLDEGEGDADADDLIEIAPHLSSHGQRTHERPAELAAQPVHGEFDEQPQLFVLPTAESEIHRPLPHLDATVADNPHIGGEVESAMPPNSPMLDEEPVPLAAPLNQPALRIDPASVGGESEDQMGNALPAPRGRVISVGASILCFNDPMGRIENEELKAIAIKGGILMRDVIRIRPGALDGLYRWDVFGEFDNESPWFIEQVAAILFPDAEPTLASLILRATKASRDDAQLRDLLPTANATDEACAAFLHESLPAAKVILGRASNNGDLARALDAIVRKLGALALVDEGQAFFDIRTSSEIDSIPVKRFAIRSLMHAKPSLVVFEIDQLDGPFIMRMAEAMYRVAERYALTTMPLHPVAAAIEFEDPEVAAAAVVAAEAARKAEAAERAELERRAALLNELRQASTNVNQIVGQLIGGDLAEQPQ